MSENVRKRVSVVVVKGDKVLGCHFVDPYSHQKLFFLPGGQMEAGETVEDTGIRETLEETGYEIKIHDEPRVFRKYQFEWNGNINNCETWYLVGELLSDKAHEVNDADYNKGADWVPLSELEKYFGYHKDILEPVQQLTGIENLQI